MMLHLAMQMSVGPFTCMCRNLFCSNMLCDMLTLQNVKGKLLLKDQICEYMDCGDALEHWSYLDFFPRNI